MSSHTLSLALQFDLVFFFSLVLLLYILDLIWCVCVCVFLRVCDMISLISFFFFGCRFFSPKKWRQRSTTFHVCMYSGQTKFNDGKLKPTNEWDEKKKKKKKKSNGSCSNHLLYWIINFFFFFFFIYHRHWSVVHFTDYNHVLAATFNTKNIQTIRQYRQQWMLLLLLLLLVRAPIIMVPIAKWIHFNP